jgi:uncharacterized protein YjeT (DUF2065 family)
MIEARELAIGVGIALALEGAFWGAAPSLMRRAVRQIETASDGMLRLTALVALALGVGIVWAARNVA